jgi:hypothetical protein
MSEMKILLANDWSEAWLRPKAGSYAIDLRGVASKKEAIVRLASTLSGKQSHPVNGDSLDALQDVIADWFYEHWTTKKTIYIAGGRSLCNLDPDLAVHVADVINSAFIAAIYDRSQVDKDTDIHLGIARTRVVFVMN